MRYPFLENVSVLYSRAIGMEIAQHFPITWVQEETN